MDPKQLPLSDRLVVICELCGVRLPTPRRDAKRLVFDHAMDEHRAALFSVTPRDRANWTRRMFRVVPERPGSPERLSA